MVVSICPLGQDNLADILDRLFLVEGVITIAFGIALIFILPDCE